MTAEYVHPGSLQQALEEVAAGATPVAGATALLTGRKRPDGRWVDVMRLGLDRIEVKGTELSIGATATLNDIADAKHIPGPVGNLLRTCLPAIASAPLRNAITLGGNFAHRVYWADLPVLFWALNGSLCVAHAGQQETIRPIDAVMSDAKVPWDKGLITAVRVPLPAAGFGIGYERFTRTVTDYALASACVSVERKDDRVANARVIVGAVQGRPVRLSSVEALLNGAVINEDLLVQVKAAAASEIVPAPNFRAPAEYRKTLASVLVQRAVSSAWKQAAEVLP